MCGGDRDELDDHVDERHGLMSVVLFLDSFIEVEERGAGESQGRKKFGFGFGFFIWCCWRFFGFSWAELWVALCFFVCCCWSFVMYVLGLFWYF